MENNVEFVECFNRTKTRNLASAEKKYPPIIQCNFDLDSSSELALVNDVGWGAAFSAIIRS